VSLLEKTLKICQENNIKPVRSRGQNFLIQENVYDEIVEAADIKSDDVILEVGPGLGFLTEKLAEKAERVIAVELDDKLANILKFRLKKEGIDNIEVVNENILDISDSRFKTEGSVYKIVANLPYNITSVFLRKFLEADNRPESMTLMLQKEVAERIVAKPGKMSLLAISVQHYAKVEIVQNVSREDFWPSPEVDSAVIKISLKNKKVETIDEKGFFRIVKFGFSSKRKMLKNNLSACLKIDQEKVENILVKVGLKKTVRAQELSLENWKDLFIFFI